jgi:proteasome lid subunit RPN8/RPN11
MDSSTPPRIPASDERRILKIPLFLWRKLLKDLRRKSEDVRESGAFLLGEHGARTDRVRSYVLYHDVDAKVSDTGIIQFSSDGYPQLWRVCRERKQRAIADVHTHPEAWVGQSDADRAHPMIPERGHISLIVPSFGQMRWWSLRTVGVHEYLGGRSWTTHTDQGRAKLRLF